jgi:hypothetical protein
MFLTLEMLTGQVSLRLRFYWRRAASAVAVVFQADLNVRICED